MTKEGLPKGKNPIFQTRKELINKTLPGFNYVPPERPPVQAPSVYKMPEEKKPKVELPEKTALQIKQSEIEKSKVETPAEDSQVLRALKTYNLNARLINAVKNSGKPNKK